MKARNLYRIVLLAGMALAMAACSEGDDLTDIQPCGIPVGFAADAFQPSLTRGTAVTPSSVQTGGIGVFAFYQKAKSNGYPVNYSQALGEPNFMYNQQLTSSDGGTTWTYSPQKYWPNNRNDQLSFFAYAPYEASTAWEEDFALTTNAKGTTLRKSFTIHPQPADQVDYLWATPVLNQKKPTDISSASPITFGFRHLCAQLNFKIQLGTKSGDTVTPAAWTDGGHTVTLDSVVVAGAYTTLNLTATYTQGGTPEMAETLSGSGSQIITLTPADLIGTNTTISTSTWSAVTTPKSLTDNASNKTLFLAPQSASSQEMTFTLRYKVHDNTTSKDTYRSTTIALSTLGITLSAFQSYTITFLLNPSAL